MPEINTKCIETGFGFIDILIIIFILIILALFYSFWVNKKIKENQESRFYIKFLIIMLSAILLNKYTFIMVLLIFWFVALFFNRIYKKKEFLTENMKISITGGYIAGAIIFSFQYTPQLACLGLATCDSVNFDKFWKIMLLLLLGFMFLLIMMSDNKNTITKNKAFVIVGYTKWGKSETLKQAFHKKRQCEVKFDGRNFLLRITSNSDISSNRDTCESYCKFIENKIKNKDIIIAFNPDYNKERYRTNYILKLLSKTHKCFFFILKNHFRTNNPIKKISKEHIKNLKKYGKVKIVNFIDDKKRAGEFENFVLKNLKS